MRENLLEDGSVEISDVAYRAMVEALRYVPEQVDLNSPRYKDADDSETVAIEVTVGWLRECRDALSPVRRPVDNCGQVGPDGLCQHLDDMTPERHAEACPIAQSYEANGKLVFAAQPGTKDYTTFVAEFVDADTAARFVRVANSHTALVDTVKAALDWHCDGTPESEMSEAEHTVVNKLLPLVGFKTIEDYVAAAR